MGSGGKVANNAGATITGGFDGVSSGSGTFTLTNAGTITGTAGVGVNINDPEPTNKATVTNTGIITGASGVEISGEGKVTNSKTITATAGKGVRHRRRRLGHQQCGRHDHRHGGGVEIDGGTGAVADSLTNDGTIKATATGTSIGVSMGSGGKVANNAGATITGG